MGGGERERESVCLRARRSFPVDLTGTMTLWTKGSEIPRDQPLRTRRRTTDAMPGLLIPGQGRGRAQERSLARSCSRCVLYHLFSLLTCRPPPSPFSFCVHLCDFKINRLWSKVSAHVQVTILPGGIFLLSRERLGYHVIRLSIHTMWVCVYLSTHAMVSHNYELMKVYNLS